MLNVFTADQAKKAARSLEKAMARQGITLPYGNALDAVASMHGHADWNSFSKKLRPATLDRFLDDHELQHIEENVGLEYGTEAMLVAHTGFQLRYSAETETCDYVRVCDPFGREIAYWVCDEWQEDPAIVMGAILGALVRGRPEEPKPFKADASASKSSEVVALPRIQDIDFTAISRIAIGGADAMQVHHTDQAILKLLADPTSELAQENADVTGVLLLETDDDFREFQEDLTLERLASLVWSPSQKCFVDPEGTTYKFYFPVTTEQYLSLTKPASAAKTPRQPASPEIGGYGNVKEVDAPFKLYDVKATLHKNGAVLPLLTRVAGRNVQEAQAQLAKQHPDATVAVATYTEFPLSVPVEYAVYFNGGLYQREIPHLKAAIDCAEFLAGSDEATEIVVNDERGHNIWTVNLDAQ